jgi:hypothetical protein
LKLTIDNNDGNGPIDYTSSIIAGRPFRILRRLNQPVTCGVTLLPASGLITPARNGRVVVADDSGNVLFTGYVATEPALELVGQGAMGAVYQAAVSAISDEILLDRQSIPQIAPLCGTTGGQAIQAMLALLDSEAITSSVALATMKRVGVPVRKQLHLVGKCGSPRCQRAQRLSAHERHAQHDARGHRHAFAQRVAGNAVAERAPGFDGQSTR